jgi:hypothetical protein
MTLNGLAEAVAVTSAPLRGNSAWRDYLTVAGARQYHLGVAAHTLLQPSLMMLSRRPRRARRRRPPGWDDHEMSVEALDVLYVPSRDVAADVAFYRDTLEARVIFAIEAMGTRVAMLELAGGPPPIVLAGHLAGDRPILVYRVADLAAAQRTLDDRGWPRGHELEIPQGPVRSFETPGGQRIAIYELTRPGVVDSFSGRRDF